MLTKKPQTQTQKKTPNQTKSKPKGTLFLVKQILFYHFIEIYFKSFSSETHDVVGNILTQKTNIIKKKIHWKMYVYVQFLL